MKYIIDIKSQLFIFVLLSLIVQFFFCNKLNKSIPEITSKNCCLPFIHRNSSQALKHWFSSYIS